VYTKFVPIDLADLDQFLLVDFDCARPSAIM
jgi:hypothetical protein